MALKPLQANIHCNGKDKKWRVFFKNQAHRKMRRMPISEDDCGRKTMRLPIAGWMC